MITPESILNKYGIGVTAFRGGEPLIPVPAFKPTLMPQPAKPTFAKLFEGYKAPAIPEIFKKAVPTLPKEIPTPKVEIPKAEPKVREQDWNDVVNAMVEFPVALASIYINPALSLYEEMTGKRAGEFSIPLLNKQKVSFKGWATDYNQRVESGQDPESAWWNASLSLGIDLAFAIPMARQVGKIYMMKKSPETLLKRIEYDTQGVRDYVSGRSAYLGQEIPSGLKEAWQKLTPEQQVNSLKGMTAVDRVIPSRVAKILGVSQEEAQALVDKAGMRIIAPERLLPQEAGTIPEYRAPQLKFGMAIEERPARKIVPEPKPVPAIPKEVMTTGELSQVQARWIEDLLGKKEFTLTDINNAIEKVNAQLQRTTSTMGRSLRKGELSILESVKIRFGEPPISKELQPLAQEAPDLFKMAQEYKAQGKSAEEFAKGIKSKIFTIDINAVKPSESLEQVRVGTSKTSGPIDVVFNKKGQLEIVEGNTRYWTQRNKGEKTIDMRFRSGLLGGYEESIKNLTDFYTQATKGADPLAQEARKYKSAEWGKTFLNKKELADFKEISPASQWAYIYKKRNPEWGKPMTHFEIMEAIQSDAFDGMIPGTKNFKGEWAMDPGFKDFYTQATKGVGEVKPEKAIPPSRAEEARQALESLKKKYPTSKIIETEISISKIEDKPFPWGDYVVQRSAKEIQQGKIYPIIVEPTPEGLYKIRDGQKRFAAYHYLGFVKIPVKTIEVKPEPKPTVFGKRPEEIMEAEFQKATGEIQMATKDTLFKDIKKLGGIRPYEGGYLAEEFSAIPRELIKKDAPNNLDEIAIELNEMGYRFSEGEAVREMIMQVKTGKIKVTKPDIEAFQKVTRMKVESPEQAKEALENYIRRIIREQKYALKRVFKETEIKARERGFVRGRRIGEREVQEKIQSRRWTLKAISAELGLTSAEIRKISKRDIRFMDDEEFKVFVDEFEIRAIQQAETRQAKSELIDLINQKDLRKTENYRKVLKLPPYSEMNEYQFRQFAEALKPFQSGDEFLSPRRLEVVDRTDLEGIKTGREARERLAKEAGVPVEELEKIKVRELDDYLWDTALAERNPLYRIMVDTVNRELLQAEARSLQIERQIFKLAKKSNESRKRGVIGRMIPQDEQIVNYLEAPIDKKAGLAMQMTAEQLDYAGYIQEKFKEALEYLIQEKALARGRENYFTHLRRTLLEDIKEDGLVNAFKHVFEHYKEDEMVFNILDQDTGNILPLEKFFAFALRRGGELAPTKNITRAFLVYWRTLEKKRALDAIVPKLDIYAQSLTPTRYTPRGLEMDRSIKQFVNKWVNTKKGRKIRWIAKQGGKVDMAIRLGRTITSIIDLGYNIFANIAATVGENVMTYQQLGIKQYALGKIRLQTKQGKTILQKYENFTGRSAWDEITEPDKPVEERLMESLFYFFRRSSVKSNQTFLLGSLTDAELQAGEVTIERLADLRRIMGRYRDIKGAQSIVGSTTAGGAATQYKRWAIPIIRTILVDIKNLAQGFAQKRIGATIKSNEAKELLRAIELVVFILVLGAYVKSNEKDDSFVGKLGHRVYVESLTILGAFESVITAPIPRVLTFLDTLGKNLRTLILLEEYKTKGGLKGIEALKRQFTPSIFRQMMPKETTLGKIPTKPEDILGKYMAPSKVDPEAILRKYGIE